MFTLFLLFVEKHCRKCIFLKVLPKRKGNQQEFIEVEEEDDEEDDDDDDDVPPPKIIEKVKEATKQSKRIRRQPVIEEEPNLRISGRANKGALLKDKQLESDLNDKLLKKLK